MIITYTISGLRMVLPDLMAAALPFSSLARELGRDDLAPELLAAELLAECRV